MSTHQQTLFLSTILNNDQAVCERNFFAEELSWLRIAIYNLVQQRCVGTISSYSSTLVVVLMAYLIEGDIHELVLRSRASLHPYLLI